MAFQWFAIVYNTRLSRKPFERVMPFFVKANVTAVVLAWASFATFLFVGTPETLIAGTVVLASIFLSISLATAWYGIKLHYAIMGKNHSSSDTDQRFKAKKKQAYKLGKRAAAFALGFFVQSLMLMISGFFGGGKGEGTALLVLTALYLASEACNLANTIRLYQHSVDKLLGKLRKKSISSSGAGSSSGGHGRRRSRYSHGRRESLNQRYRESLTPRSSRQPRPSIFSGDSHSRRASISSAGHHRRQSTNYHNPYHGRNRSIESTLRREARTSSSANRKSLEMGMMSRLETPRASVPPVDLRRGSVRQSVFHNKPAAGLLAVEEKHHARMKSPLINEVGESSIDEEGGQISRSRTPVLERRGLERASITGYGKETGGVKKI
mmetsp:Transcript_22901/g.36795  ORF Transcript_22901/g.36795 Transcript_22901/m.36795 type:complete len:381 (-) Transcript_22901:43-1185(-)